MGNKQSSSASVSATTEDDYEQESNNKITKHTAMKRRGISESTEFHLAEDELAIVKKKRSRSSSMTLGLFEPTEAKWKKKEFVIGALEVHCCPYLDVRAQLRPRAKQGSEEVFQKAMDAWNKLRLRQSFANAAENIPVETRCFGFVKDDDKTMKSISTKLNQKWVDAQNHKLEDLGFELDVYFWSILNVGGKATTNKLLIRFFELE